MPRFVYILPVHNETAVLRDNVARLLARLQALAGAQVLLVENGSRDASWPLCQQLASELSDDRGTVVQEFREDNAGIGYAYHRGMTEALAQFGPSPDHYAVLTAADLPFGFTDLDGVLARVQAGGAGHVFVGSKAHKQSQVQTDALRQVMTLGYRLARRAVIGMKTADSQGTVFLPLALAAEVLPLVKARGFFYSTELLHFLEQRGAAIEELPVTLERATRASTVKPWTHGSQMARQLFELRARSKM